MSGGDRDNLELEWKKWFGQYFGKTDIDDRIKGVSESRAPYYAQKDARFNNAHVLSVDIGGGTTDVAMFFSEELIGTTSFKFAGNALFGDAYSVGGHGADKNGFVMRFAPKFRKLLEGEYGQATGVLKELLSKQKADDINAFFFSVENNIEHWARQEHGQTSVNKDQYSYSVLIKRDGRDLMFLILYFYVALLYHIAQVLRSIPTPSDGKPIKLKFVIFSGTASKILRILTNNEKRLVKLAAEVFKRFGLADDNLSIILAEEPKEATCNGGLKMDFAGKGKEAGNTVVDTDNGVAKFVYSCVKEGLDPVTYDDYLKDVDKGKESLIRKSLIDFHEFFFKLDTPDCMEFSDAFVIDAAVTKYVKEHYKSLIDSWVGAAIAEEQKVYKIETNKPAQETPFFMPLKAIIHELSRAIENREYNK